MKRVVVRAKADEDIDRAIKYCALEDPRRVDALISALEATFRRAARLPRSGSPRYAHELDIEGLRVLPTGQFPYLVFYMETPREVVVLRVLHKRRDMASVLSE